MLETPTPAPPSDSSSAAVKRYAPPNQRNRSRNRGKSRGGSNFLNENSCPALIALGWWCRSEACQLLNDRWTSVMHRYNDTSVDLSERPVMYSGRSASAWEHFRLHHQLMPPANSVGPSTGSQTDFLSELGHAILNANVGSNN